MRKFTFNKEVDDRWYVELPEWEGSKADLEMVSGADTMLNIISEGESTVSLIISIETFVGSDVLELINMDNDFGGGWYMLKSYKGIDFNLKMWLCSVTEFLYSKMPNEIFICKVD